MKPEDMEDSELSTGIAKKRAAVDGTGNFMHYASGLLALGGLFAIGMTGMPAIASILTVGSIVFGVTIAGALVARGRVQRLKEEARPLQAEQEDRFANPGKRMQKLTEKFERSLKSGVDKDIVVNKPLQIKKPQP